MVFSITEFTKIKKVGKEGHLQLTNDNEILLMRKDHTPIFLVRFEDKMKFYELDNLTEHEKTVVNRFYEIVLTDYLPKMDNTMKSITLLAMATGIVDYHIIFDTKIFKNGELLLA